MNTQAGYVVQHQHEALELTKTLFTHGKLLTARKMAMSYAETLLAQLWKRGTYTTTIEIHLVKANEGPLTAESSSVALVYQLDLSADRSQTFAQAKEAEHDALEQLHEEYAYYQMHDYSMGFGYFRTEIQEGDQHSIYCLLHDAMGYLTDIVSRPCNHATEGDDARFQMSSTLYDQHTITGPLIDALIH